jgi:hypothetical protein
MELQLEDFKQHLRIGRSVGKNVYPLKGVCSGDKMSLDSSDDSDRTWEFNLLSQDTSKEYCHLTSGCLW